MYEADHTWLSAQLKTILSGYKTNHVERWMKCIRIMSELCHCKFYTFSEKNYRKMSAFHFFWLKTKYIAVKTKIIL